MIFHLLSFACALLLETPVAAEFKPLIVGDIATSFEHINIDPADVTIVDGEIRIMGMSRGYLATKADYGDFILKFSWKIDVSEGKKSLEVEANSGVLIRIKPPHRVWPESVEYQLNAEDPAALFGLKASFDGNTDANAQRLAERQLGEWNEGEIEAVGERVVSRLNGRVISVGKIKPGRGAIGLQIQRGGVRFRDLKIKTLEPK